MEGNNNNPFQRHQLMNCIERFVQAIVLDIANGITPVLSMLDRSSKSTQWDDETGILMHNGTQKRVQLNMTSARKFTAILLVLQTVYSLLKENKTLTQRELYYMHPFFKSQSEADEAILDASSLLSVPRISIHIIGTTKGAFAGSIRLHFENGTVLDGDTATGLSITSDMLESSAASVRIESSAEYIILIEKDGIFRRLCEDGFYKHHVPSILITGRGFPDLATRAFARLLSDRLSLPSVVLCDCNPFGMAIALTYKLGSARMPIDSAFYTIDAKWIGLRPSAVIDLDLPERVKQPFTSRDVSKLNSLIQSPYIQATNAYHNELKKMEELQYKVELEALHSFGFSFITHFLAAKFHEKDFI